MALGPKTDNSIEGGDGNAQVGHNSGSITIGLTFEQHQAVLEKALKEKAADLERAHGAERELLQREIDDLRRKLNDPQASLIEAQKRIADLKFQLEREGNEFGAQRIDEAVAAMNKGDFSLADDIFAEIEAREELAVKRASRAAYGRGEVAEAKVRWQDAAKHYARAAQLDPNFETLVQAREFAWRAGDYKSAMRYGEELLLLAEQGALTESQKSAAFNDHAITLKELGRCVKAEVLFRRALFIAKATHGPEHPVYAIRLNNLASVLQEQGYYSEAEDLFRQALTIGKATFGFDPIFYTTGLNNLAAVFQEQGRYAAAEKLYHQALAVGDTIFDYEHPYYAINLNNLASVLALQGRYDAAQGYCRQAIQIFEATLGDTHPNTIKSRKNLETLIANSKL